jgi:large subunit ribosomal protein L21
MYAIIQTGGKQYKVAAGETVRIEKLAGEIGDNVKLHDVLLIAEGDKIQIGKPVLDGAFVGGTIVDQGKEKKVVDVTFRRRKNSMKTKGHRQPFTAVKINEIKGA